MKPLFALIAVVGSACAPEGPSVVVTENKPIALPAECTSADQPWHQLLDADVKLSEAARHERINKDHYAELLSKRRVCRTAINASLGGK